MKIVRKERKRIIPQAGEVMLAELTQRKQELDAELSYVRKSRLWGQVHQVSAMLQYATIQIKEIMARKAA